MKTGSVFSVFALFICLTICSQVTADEATLRNTLENSWHNYLNAARSGDASQLEMTMSSFRLGEMKNNLARMGRSLTPDLIKSLPEDATDISAAKFVKLLENGPTAGLVYVMDSEEKDASNQPRINFIFIKFVNENEVWKVDGEMDMGSPKFQADGKETEFNPSDLPPTYEIDGKVLKAPEKISIPDISGSLDVSSYGYQTEISINGVAQEAVLDKSYSGLLKSGLRKGKNTIVIRLKKIEDNPVFKPTVTINSLLADGNVKEIFKFEPQDNIEGTHTFDFTAGE